jgi:hypothetical protein
VRPLLAIARVTVADAIRSRLALALVIGLAGALGVLAAQATGDGSATGGVRAFLSAALDATWALLALAAVFLSTSSLSRELEDGRAIPIGVTPVRAAEILLGKCLGIGAVLAVALGLALAFTIVVVTARARSAPPEDRARIEAEILTARAELDPPRIDTDSKEIQKRAQDRLERILVEDPKAVPPGTKTEAVLKKLLDDELVQALSVRSGQTFTWHFDPIDPAPDADSITLRFKYRTLPEMPSGAGPRGAFALDVAGKRVQVWEIASAPRAWHELTLGGKYLRRPVILTADGGKVTRATEAEVTVDGRTQPLPEGYKATVSEGDQLSPRAVIARAEKITLSVTYQNVEPDVVVTFPPEGVALLVSDRNLGANVFAAFGLLLGRLVFLVACGLALSTFLEGRVAALATFFVLAVAASHGFLESAVGPILASPEENVFGILDVPIKGLLRGVLWLLPDLGRFDAGEALAQGRSVLGAGLSLLLALLGGGGSLVLGSTILERRELAS